MLERFLDTFMYGFVGGKFSVISIGLIWSYCDLVITTGLRIAFGARARLKVKMR